jgi:hypothetical protein
MYSDGKALGFSTRMDVLYKATFSFTLSNVTWTKKTNAQINAKQQGNLTWIIFLSQKIKLND